MMMLLMMMIVLMENRSSTARYTTKYRDRVVQEELRKIPISTKARRMGLMCGRYTFLLFLSAMGVGG